MDDAAYRIRLVRAITFAGKRYPPGTVVSLPGGRLSVASFHIRNGCAVAHDDGTRLAVAVFDLMRELDRMAA